MAGERRLYLERNCRLPESPAHSRRRNREGPASSKGLNSQRGFGPAVEPRRKSRPRSTSLHGSSPCKCQRLSTLRWDRLPPSRPSTKSGARAGGRRLSDRRLHRWLAGTSASAPSSHGAADLLGLNRAHICVRNPSSRLSSGATGAPCGSRFCRQPFHLGTFLLLTPTAATVGTPTLAADVIRLCETGTAIAASCQCPPGQGGTQHEASTRRKLRRDRSPSP